MRRVRGEGRIPCGKPVGKNREWCSEACVEEYKIRAWPGFARRRVWERDRGVCAMCGADTEQLHRLHEEALSRLREFDNHRTPLADRSRLYEEEVAARVARVEERQRNGRRHAWEMDHVNPVVEGGGGCGLDNLRTLCLPCHRRVTAELAARRAEERRQAQQPLLPGVATPSGRGA